MEGLSNDSNVVRADFTANRQAIARANSPFGPVRAGLVVPRAHQGSETTSTFDDARDHYRVSTIIGYSAGLACGNPAEIGDDGVTYYDC